MDVTLFIKDLLDETLFIKDLLDETLFIKDLYPYSRSREPADNFESRMYRASGREGNTGSKLLRHVLPRSCLRQEVKHDTAHKNRRKYPHKSTRNVNKNKLPRLNQEHINALNYI